MPVQILCEQWVGGGPYAYCPAFHGQMMAEISLESVAGMPGAEALLLAALGRNTAVMAGMHMSIPALLRELTAMCEAAVICPQGTPAHRIDHIILSRMSAKQRNLPTASRSPTSSQGETQPPPQLTQSE
jgi:hypothetical protein